MSPVNIEEHSPSALICDLTVETMASIANSLHFSGDADMILGLEGNDKIQKKCKFSCQGNWSATKSAQDTKVFSHGIHGKGFCASSAICVTEVFRIKTKITVS